MERIVEALIAHQAAPKEVASGTQMPRKEERH
jgi:hypothetical protein